MSFLCLWFVVRIDLLDANGDVGGLRRRWWATFLLSQGLCFSFISCKCVVVSLKSYVDSIYSHKFNIIYLVCVWILLILLKIENNKKNIFWLLFINEFTVYWPDCTVHVPWTVHQALVPKKKKSLKARKMQMWEARLRFPNAPSKKLLLFFFPKLLNQTCIQNLF